MIKVRFAILGLVALTQIFGMNAAVAQVPPHNPGTICFTDRFWCWANPPGMPGASCACPSPYGWTPGRLG